jgi:hypothetical protein
MLCPLLAVSCDDARLALFTLSHLREWTIEEEIRNVNLINEQFCLIQRGVDESQYSFEILIDAFVHAEQGTLQSQLITAEEIKQFYEVRSCQVDWLTLTFLFQNSRKL